MITGIDTIGLEDAEYKILDEEFSDYYGDDLGFVRFFDFTEVQLDGVYSLDELTRLTTAMRRMRELYTDRHTVK